MREMTFMDAAREGLAEEMARDPTMFVVGEGIGARGGNFSTTVGLYRALWRRAAARHADQRARLHRPVHRRGDDRRAAGGGFHVHRFRPRRLRRDGQPDGQDAVDERRPRSRCPSCCAAASASATRRRPSLRQLLPVLHAHSRLPGGRAQHARRRQGPAQDGHSLRRSGAVPGAREPC